MPETRGTVWWRGSRGAGLAAVVAGVDALVWTGIVDGRDSKPKVEMMDRRLVEIEKSTTATKKALVEIKTTMNAAVIQRIDGLERTAAAAARARAGVKPNDHGAMDADPFNRDRPR